MAIDYTGKTATSTTGTIGATPFVPKPADTSNLGVSQPTAKNQLQLHRKYDHR